MRAKRVRATPSEDYVDSEERRAIRRALLAAGFTRSDYTMVTEDGSYSEAWRHPSGSSASLAWSTWPGLPTYREANG